MKNFNYILFCLFFILSNACTEKKVSFKVLQFNTWQEGTMVADGYESIVEQIIASDADFVTLSEVLNYKNIRFCDRLIQSLKEKGKQYYSFYSDDSGILSRYPIIDSAAIFPPENGHGSIYRALINMDGQKVALYTAHLDYQSLYHYDIKGYDGTTWEKRPYISDIESIINLTENSWRNGAIRMFIKYANEDKGKGYIVLLGGDFNEPSHLDWVESTKDRFDHQNLVIPWTVSTMLYENGYWDTYRECFPNPLTHPGITFPSYIQGIDPSRITRTPEADERERIDFIYYSPTRGLTLTDVCIWGPEKSIARNKQTKEYSQDIFRTGEEGWPSDHKAVLATFKLSRK